MPGSRSAVFIRINSIQGFDYELDLIYFRCADTDVFGFCRFRPSSISSNDEFSSIMKLVTSLMFLIATCTSSLGMEYTVPFSEFSVEFSSDPNTQIISTVLEDGSVVEGVMAKLVRVGSVTWAEFFPVSNPVGASSLSDEEIRHRHLEYAKHNGLKVSHVAIDQFQGFRVSELRGTKILTESGKDVAVTYENRVYYGIKSLLSIYVGGKSENYPTDDIQNFLSSVRVHSASKESSPSFLRFDLPHGASIDLPSNWWLLSRDMNATIEAAGNAARNLIGIDLEDRKKTNLIRANSMPRSTYASVAVNATESDIMPEELQSASASDLKELEEGILEVTRRSLALQNSEILDVYGLERRSISGYPAIVYSYKRSGLNGPVVVIMTRLFLGTLELSFNLSYRESEKDLWGPVIDRIRNSISVKHRP